MPFKKGQSGNPAGKPKGSQGKATLEFKEATTKLLDFAAPKMVQWMDAVAQEDPNKALDHAFKFAQFSFPLMARQDVNQRFVNKDGDDLAAEDIEILKRYKNKIKGDQGDD